jgi:type I restriction enzyme S subunit
MKKYDKTQETGIFFNQIPAHWEIKRGKDVIEILSGYPFASELFDIDATLGFPLIRIRNVVTGTTDTYYKGDVLPEYLINSGDILIGMDGDYNCAIWNSEPALLNQRVCRVKGKNGLLDKYLFYSLPFHLQIINDLTYFTTVKHLSTNDIKGISLPVPPLPEQKAIVAYLDRKTDQLDTLLAQKQILLHKLHQKRQALINEAVTQGLDPTTSRKPSGIAWLGDVPEHWEIKKLKYLFDASLGGGTPDTTNDNFWNGDLPWVSPKDMKSPVILATQDYVTELAVKSSSTNLIPEKSVLVVVRSGILKHTFPVAINAIPVTLNQDMKAFVPNSLITAEYLAQLLKGFQQHILNQCTKIGATVDSVEMEWLYSFPFPVPPCEEQERIVAYLDKSNTQINEATSTIHTQIKTLKAYRQSLISEVVTGKVDVRPVVLAPEADLPLWMQ